MVKYTPLFPFEICEKIIEFPAPSTFTRYLLVPCKLIPINDDAPILKVNYFLINFIKFHKIIYHLELFRNSK